MWFRKKYRVPARRRPDATDDSWITVPFRFAEAARVSIYTISRQPEIPLQLRNWISQWLAAYNSQLVFYMRDNYGPDIFPLLDRITFSVMPTDDGAETADERGVGDSWEKWEGQFTEGDK